MVWGMFLLLINVGSTYKGQKRQKALLNYGGFFMGVGWGRGSTLIVNLSATGGNKV